MANTETTDLQAGNIDIVENSAQMSEGAPTMGEQPSEKAETKSYAYRQRNLQNQIEDNNQVIETQEKKLEQERAVNEAVEKIATTSKLVYGENSFFSSKEGEPLKTALETGNKDVIQKYADAGYFNPKTKEGAEVLEQICAYGNATALAHVIETGALSKEQIDHYSNWCNKAVTARAEHKVAKDTEKGESGLWNTMTGGLSKGWDWFRNSIIGKPFGMTDANLKQGTGLVGAIYSVFKPGEQQDPNSSFFGRLIGGTVSNVVDMPMLAVNNTFGLAKDAVGLVGDGVEYVAGQTVATPFKLVESTVAGFQQAVGVGLGFGGGEKTETELKREIQQQEQTIEAGGNVMSARYDSVSIALQNNAQKVGNTSDTQMRDIREITEAGRV